MDPVEYLAGVHLSRRGKHSFQCYDFLIEYLIRALENQYNLETNPEGIVNFGTSQNHLMQKELEERLRREDVFFFSSKNHQHYFQFSGKPVLKTALSKFFNRYFNVAKPILADELIILSGSSSCLDALAYTLFDPEDICLTTTPTYLGMLVDFNIRSMVTPIELELPDKSEEHGISFQLTSELLENKILEIMDGGKMVKGFALISPQNPLGDIYSPMLLRKLLEVCAKYKIHVIVDEVYMLSIWSSISATSVMSLPDVPDPQRTHVIWAMSKDFCLPGFRLGVVWTKNSAVRKTIENFSFHYCCPSIIQDTAATILSDFKWLDEIYFPTSCSRMQENYTSAAKKLRTMGAVVRPSRAGFFVWFHLKKFLSEQTFEGEMELFEEFFDAGVYIIPGSKFRCSSPGWFRMVFTLSRVELDRGFAIMKKILKLRENMAKTFKSD